MKTKPRNPFARKRISDPPAPGGFRALVESACRRGCTPTERPRSLSWAAKNCGLTVQYLFRLMAGASAPPPWTVAKLAKGLGVSAAAIDSALRASAAASTKVKP